MNSVEYEKLAQVEQEHWFYSGKREIVLRWIARFIQLKPEALLIDAGMGTGTWALQMASRCRVVGIDDHAESLALATPRLSAAGGETLKSSLTSVDLPSGCAAVITMMDVLEHIDDDELALREMLRLTRKGGLIVLTVPALPWLWSDWDEVLHHRRRYTKRQLLGLMRQPEATVLRCAYFNTLMLPAIALVRSYRRLRPRNNQASRLEDRIPPAVLNRIFRALLVGPACSSWFPALSGASLLGIIRKA